MEITDTAGLVGRPQGLRIVVRPEPVYLKYAKDLKPSRKAPYRDQATSGAT
ncbi:MULTISPECIES: hypothetical protein [unclassified Streptomyces]|uniref:hypothetical protein n=1 Tax=unclassified Streptomyces TaxID=2593676 RepID=UPI0033B5F4AC